LENADGVEDEGWLGGWGSSELGQLLAARAIGLRHVQSDWHAARALARASSCMTGWNAPDAFGPEELQSLHSPYNPAQAVLTMALSVYLRKTCLRLRCWCLVRLYLLQLPLWAPNAVSDLSRSFQTGYQQPAK